MFMASPLILGECGIAWRFGGQSNEVGLRCLAGLALAPCRDGAYF
jgi:hypothetical protein